MVLTRSKSQFYGEEMRKGTSKTLFNPTKAKPEMVITAIILMIEGWRRAESGEGLF